MAPRGFKNDVKEWRKEKEERAEGKKDYATFVFILATLGHTALTIEESKHGLSGPIFKTSHANWTVCSLK